MNRLYLLANDGRVFFTEPPQSENNLNSNLSSTNEENSNSLCNFQLLRDSSFTKIKKLASSEWCMWCLTSQFTINLFVFDSKNQLGPFEKQETTYENQVDFLDLF